VKDYKLLKKQSITEKYIKNTLVLTEMQNAVDPVFIAAME